MCTFCFCLQTQGVDDSLCHATGNLFVYGRCWPLKGLPLMLAVCCPSSALSI